MRMASGCLGLTGGGVVDRVSQGAGDSAVVVAGSEDRLAHELHDAPVCSARCRCETVQEHVVGSMNVARSTNHVPTDRGTSRTLQTLRTKNGDRSATERRCAVELYQSGRSGACCSAGHRAPPQAV